MENSIVFPNEEALVSPLLSESGEASGATMELLKAESNPVEVDDAVTELELRDETTAPQIILRNSTEKLNTTDGLSSDEEEESESPSENPLVPVVPSETVNELYESLAHPEIVASTVEPQVVVKDSHHHQHATEHSPLPPPLRPQYTKITEMKEETRKRDIISLPIDSLHCIASFLTPAEWSNFGQTGGPANRVCREVVRRVRMHGFRCATEIVTAWKLGHHTDSRELSALYIQAGVPVYPRSLGHSYHTLVWRMGVEVATMQEAETETEPSLNPVPPPPCVDPFYTERSEFRTLEGYYPHITYLEEKSVFWMSKAAADPLNPAVHRPIFPFVHEAARNINLNANVNARAPVAEANALRGSPAPKSDATHDRTTPKLPPKIPLQLHEHLYNQHILGKVYVDDQDGAMVTPPVSLSADFFHPASHSYPGTPLTAAKPKAESRTDVVATLAVLDQVLLEEAIDDTARLAIDAVIQPEVLVEPAAGVVAQDPSVQPNINNPEDILGEPNEEHDRANFEPPPPITAWRLQSTLKYLNLEIYASSITGSPKSDVVDGSQEMKKHLRSRFTTYQRRLEALLSQGDNNGFEESILDFWDEFFPHSAMIQYFDLHTAVPRISCLQKFLTRPCPKSIGTIQCEIERIKIPARGKGVSMKGRLFPTYEYRLFIRDRPPISSTAPESATMEEDDYTRRDTVLMVARNKGRKHVNAPGVVPISSSSKKGSNNYYLHMPQQIDVDAHYNKVNENEESTRMNPNGVNNDPFIVSDEAGSVLLGRLQSNFIGTEFQIFTPRMRKRARRKPDSYNPPVSSYSPSDDELDYDSGMSSDNNTSSRRRFGRLSRRRNNNPANTEKQTGSVNSDASPTPNRIVKRAKSCSDLPQPQGRLTRPNRRAIANTPTPENQEPVLCEEEDGVITYTANLLGSRPRIMDVCIPKVTVDGVAGAVWKQHLESFDDTEDCRMLSCLRQLQQLHEQQDQNGGVGEANQDNNLETAANAAPDDFGLLALQNRPPWWNIDLGSFVLNFGGRVSVASVKNFQLCDRNDQDRIMLQFGRIKGRHSFTMDFQHPLTAVQAFSIAISSLQSKISFG